MMFGSYQSKFDEQAELVTQGPASTSNGTLHSNPQTQITFTNSVQDPKTPCFTKVSGDIALDVTS